MYLATIAIRLPLGAVITDVTKAETNSSCESLSHTFFEKSKIIGSLHVFPQSLDLLNSVHPATLCPPLIEPEVLQ